MIRDGPSYELREDRRQPAFDKPSPKEGIGDPFSKSGPGKDEVGFWLCVDPGYRHSQTFEASSKQRNPGPWDGKRWDSQFHTKASTRRHTLYSFVSMPHPVVLSRLFSLVFQETIRVGGPLCSSRVVHRMILADHAIRMLCIFRAVAPYFETKARGKPLLQQKAFRL